MNRFRLSPRLHWLAACFAPLLLVMAGCGSNPSSNPSNGTFSITPGQQTIDTNGEVQFTAALANGQPAAVTWTVSTGTNNSNLGQGSIDSSGLYIPPSAVSDNSVKVQVQANLTGNPYQTVTAVITVTPGFATTLTPETATVGTGASVKLTATIAQYGGGSVNWALSNTATGGSGASGAGSIGSTNCQSGGGVNSSNPYLTYCTATYTAPSSVPSGAVYVVASVASNTTSTTAAKLLLNSAGLNTSPLENQATQTGAILLGTSGGNNNDVDTDSNGNVTDCASGTLGSLVADQANNLYILSNNHVLAESDQAAVGDTIIQPGLVDTGCSQLATGVSGITAVGTLEYWVPIGSASTNVDAALAATSASAVNAGGQIIALGAAGGGTSQIAAAAPVAGTGEVLTAANLNSLTVAKSGRTTGLTCSTVDSIDDTIKVSYYKDAAETIFYYAKTFTNQIGIPGNYFSDSGDSGSLVVDTSNAQPVALFFAGATGTATQVGESFAQPIGEVLTELAEYSAAPSGTTFTMVGGAPHTVSCLNYDANTATTGAAVSTARMSAARAVASGAAAALVNPSRGILGVAAGKSLDEPGQAAVVVYVDEARAGSVAVPQTIGGLPTRVVATTASAVASGNVAAAQTGHGIQLSQAVIDAAKSVKAQNAHHIMRDPAFFGVGVAQSHDNPSEAALMVFVDRAKTPRSMPATVGGLRVRYRVMNAIKVNFAQHAGVKATGAGN